MKNIEGAHSRRTRILGKNYKVITPVYNEAPYLAMEPKAIFAKLKDGPLVTSVYALNDCWRYYESGIWDSKIMEKCPVTWQP